jgi:alpha-beta hydrolase superfamily lysophospholipase
MSRILLVHGAWHGPWCWNDFANRLRSSGHDVQAVRLRGHDGRSGRLWCRLRDYVDGVEQTAGTIRRAAGPGRSFPWRVAGAEVPGAAHRGRRRADGIPPARRNPARRAAFREAPPHRADKGDPAGQPAALHHVRGVGAGVVLQPRYIAPNRRPDSMGHLQDDSCRAFLDVLHQRWRPPKNPLPVLVLGAEHDGFLTSAEVERTGRTYAAKVHIFPRMGHNLMLDDGWQKVADSVDAWVHEIEEGPTAGSDSRV